MRPRFSALLLLAAAGAASSLSAQVPAERPPLRVGEALPPLLDLTDADAAALVPADPRDPAQVEAARRAWAPRLAPFRNAPTVRVKLPVAGPRVALLLAATQALKAASMDQWVYLAPTPGAPPILDEAAWGAVDGGAMGPDDLGPDPAAWRARLVAAQDAFPGRTWFLWLPSDPGALVSALMGDGGRPILPTGGPGEELARALPAGFNDVEGGPGDLTLRNRAGQARRWRFERGRWVDAPLPATRHEVVVAAEDAYDVAALVARMRAAQLRDRAALRTLEADLAVTIHLQGVGGPGMDLGFSFRLFERIGETEELLQREVRFNGMKAKLPDGVDLPVIESRASLAQPVTLSLTERYRYTDGGPDAPGRRRLRFAPVEPDPTLFRGELVVDEASGRVLEERSQREGLPGTVKSERRILTYGVVGNGWRPVRTQTYERWVSPGGVAQVQRLLELSSPQVDAEGFDQRREAVRTAPGTLLKQTPDGLRYFARQADGTRRLEERPRTGGRALGGVLIVDPGLTPPVLPLGGLAFFEFNAFNKGIQVNAFTALVFNALSVAVPRLPGGFGLNLNASAMLLATDERPVRQGRLADREGVGRRFAQASVELGRDLGAGFRVEVQGRFQLNQFTEARDEARRTPGFLLPPNGWTRELRGEASWQWRGFQVKGFTGKGRRPEGQFGDPAAQEVIADGGAFTRWGGSLGLDRDLGRGLRGFAEVASYAGRGFDRFNALQVGGLRGSVVGIRANALAADRLLAAKAGVTLPAGPRIRLSAGLDHARARSFDDGLTYRFSGARLSGDLPGFGWFTAARVDLGVGLQSDVPGVKTVNGLLTLLRVF